VAVIAAVVDFLDTVELDVVVVVVVDDVSADIVVDLVGPFAPLDVVVEIGQVVVVVGADSVAVVDTIPQLMVAVAV